MSKPPVDLLARPAPAAAALVGLALLDEARVGCGRLAALDDAEALHDFRVALRRVRSALRSFRAELGDAVPKKLQRRLRDVTRATGAARDAEVQLGWVRSHRAELGRRLAPGLPWLLARLAQQQEQAYADLRRTVPPEFRQLERRVRRGLSATLLEAGPAAPSFAAAISPLIREHVAELEQELAAARAGPDADAIHAARIAVKRLRYLLEPLRRRAAAARPYARVAEAAADAARRAARPSGPRGRAGSRRRRSRSRAGAPSPCGRAAGRSVRSACSRPAAGTPARQRRAPRLGPTRRPNSRRAVSASRGGVVRRLARGTHASAACLRRRHGGRRRASTPAPPQVPRRSPGGVTEPLHSTGFSVTWSCSFHRRCFDTTA